MEYKNLLPDNTKKYFYGSNTFKTFGSYLQELYTNIYKVIKEANSVDLPLLLQDLYQVFMIVDNYIDVHIPDFVFVEIPNMIFCLDLDNKIKSTALLILREIIRRSNYYYENKVDIIADLIAFLECNASLFYECLTILKQCALKSVEYSEEILTLINYGGLLNYLVENDASAITYIAELLLNIKCSFTQDCIAFIYDIGVLFIHKCTEKPEAIVKCNAILKLVAIIIKNEEGYILCLRSNVLQQIIYTCISSKYYKCCIHDIIIIWKTVITNYNNDFCIDIFEIIYRYHDIIQIDFLDLCIEAIQVSTKYYLFLSENLYIDKLCTDLTNITWCNKQKAVKYIWLYFSHPNTPPDIIRQYNARYNLYEKILNLYGRTSEEEEEKGEEEEEGGENIGVLLIKLIETSGD